MSHPQIRNLSNEVFERVFPHLEPIDLTHGKILYDMDGPITDVYFPNNAMVSLVTEMADARRSRWD
jgi:hypothetical protein